MFTRFSHSSRFHKILLIQFGTIRDVIRTLPIINILRFHHPHAKIAWLAAPEMIDFLNSYDIADWLMLAKPGWYKKIAEIQALRKRLHSFEPDLCLDLQGDVTSGLALKLSGCRKRVSINGTRGGFFGKVKNTQPSEYQLEQHRQLLDRLNVTGVSINHALPEIPGESRSIGGIVRELDLEITPFAMLGIGVQSNSTFWEIDRYIQVAEHLGHTLNLPTVVTWQGERERRIAEKVVAESGEMVMLAPVLSAIQFAALARRTLIYVGGDNDFLHIAAAVGPPCIAVFCGDYSRRDTPYCSNFQMIRARTGETRRNRSGVDAGNDPIRIDNYTYDVIQVCNACDDILQPRRAENRVQRPEHRVEVEC